MSEVELNKGYRYDRVIMDETDVLDSEFSDAVIHLTGGQLNILRNLMEYAAQRMSFYSSQSQDYYTMPDDDTWDDLSDIIADLELKLMGNDNVIWGYNDRLALYVLHTKVGAGSHLLDVGTVPAGEVWKVHSTLGLNGTTTVVHQHYINDGTYAYYVSRFAAQPANLWSSNDGVCYTLKEGDTIGIAFWNCLDGDLLRGAVLGYKMNVPE